MPTGPGQRCPGGQDARPREPPARDLVAQTDREPAPVAEVAHGGHPRGEEPPGPLGHPAVQLGVGGGPQGSHRIGTRVEREVHVGVDESRQQRAPREGEPGNGRTGLGFDLGARVEPP